MSAPQPAVVRSATILMVVSGVLTVLEAVSTLRNVGSAETVSALNESLSVGWAKSAHLSITTLQETLRVSANVSAILAAAVVVLAVFAGRGSRQSRTALAVLAVPVLLASLMAAGYAGLGMLIGIGLLWSRNARPWFAAESPAGQPASAVAGPAYSYPAGVPTPPMPSAVPTVRPARVTAAAVVAIVLSTLAAVGGLLGGIGLVALHGRADLRENFVNQLRDRQISMSLDDLNRYLTAATVAAAVIAVLGLLGVLAAVLVLQRSSRARIALIALSAICAVISLVLITSVISVIWLIGALSVIFGLRAADSAAWFSQR